MRRWSEIAEQIASTSRTSEKVRRLAEYLPSLTPAELPVAVTYLSGRAFAERDPRTTGLGWAAVAAAAEEVAESRGPGPKGAILRGLLWRCDPLTAKYVVKILSGELRIGLREGHLEAAVAAA